MRPFAGCDPRLARRAGEVRAIPRLRSCPRAQCSARHKRLRLFEVEEIQLEAVLVANLDRVSEAFGGDQRSDRTLAPARSISASLHHIAARTCAASD